MNAKSPERAKYVPDDSARAFASMAFETKAIPLPVPTEEEDNCNEQMLRSPLRELCLLEAEYIAAHSVGLVGDE